MKLYVGNLNYSVENKDLEELFSAYGKVNMVNVIEGKGFGFVEMDDDAEAEKAKQELHGKDHKGRKLKVDQATPPSNQRREAEIPPRPEAPVEDWSHLSPDEIQSRLQEMIQGSNLKETGFGARRFYYVARDGRMPFLDISDDLTSRLEKGLAAVVEIPGDENGEVTIVPRAIAQQMKSVDPESVRFLNPDTSHEPPRRRPPRRNSY